MAVCLEGACGALSCLECGREAHGAIACAVHRALMQRCESGVDAVGMITQCPECSYMQEKEKGSCDHIVCGSKTHGARRAADPGCGHEFCFKCRRAWATHPSVYYCQLEPDRDAREMDLRPLRECVAIGPDAVTNARLEGEDAKRAYLQAVGMYGHARVLLQEVESFLRFSARGDEELLASEAATLAWCAQSRGTLVYAWTRYLQGDLSSCADVVRAARLVAIQADVQVPNTDCATAVRELLSLYPSISDRQARTLVGPLCMGELGRARLGAACGAQYKRIKAELGAAGAGEYAARAS